MTELKGKSDLAVSTRDMVFAFFLAKGVSLLVVLFVQSRGQGDENLAFAAASVVAVAVFIALVLLTGKCTLSALLRITRPTRPSWPAHVTLVLILLAVPLGFLLRLGTGGLVLGTLQVFVPAMVAAETTDVLSALKDSAYGLTSMLVVATIAGAGQEELLYRQVLQSRLCSRYGLTAGILIISALFCTMHLGNPTTFTAGIFFSLLYAFTGRLCVPIVAHVSANLALPVLTTLQVAASAPGLALVMYVSAVILCLVVVAMIIAISKRTVPAYKRQPVFRQADASAAPE